jgi:hypothetical protein
MIRLVEFDGEDGGDTDLDNDMVLHKIILFRFSISLLVLECRPSLLKLNVLCP